MNIPARYRDLFVDVNAVVSVGPRSTLARRWRCNRCGKCIKPNTAEAQSHVVMHVRQRTMIDATEHQP